LAGIHSLQIHTDDEGETSQTNVSIVGMGQNGEALGGKAKSKAVSLEDHEISTSPLDKTLCHQGAWVDGQIHLNIPEVKQQLLHSGQSLKDPIAWSSIIDTAIKSGIRKIGNNHLLKDFRGLDIGTLGPTYALGILSAIRYDLNTYASLTALSAINIGENAVISCLENNFEHSGGGRRWSLVPGPELDRALIFNVGLSTLRLAKPLTASV
jgi:hypothetical protein